LNETVSQFIELRIYKMPPFESLEKCKRLIGKNRVKDALKILEKLSIDEQLLTTEIILHKSNFVTYKESVRLGKLASDEAANRLSIIKGNLLEFIELFQEELEEKYSSQNKTNLDEADMPLEKKAKPVIEEPQSKKEDKSSLANDGKIVNESTDTNNSANSINGDNNMQWSHISDSSITIIIQPKESDSKEPTPTPQETAPPNKAQSNESDMPSEKKAEPVVESQNKKGDKSSSDNAGQPVNDPKTTKDSNKTSDNVKDEDKANCLKVFVIVLGLGLIIICINVCKNEPSKLIEAEKSNVPMPAASPQPINQVGTTVDAIKPKPTKPPLVTITPATTVSRQAPTTLPPAPVTEIKKSPSEVFSFTIESKDSKRKDINFEEKLAQALTSTKGGKEIKIIYMIADRQRRLLINGSERDFNVDSVVAMVNFINLNIK
jgi:hypothetical protein